MGTVEWYATISTGSELDTCKLLNAYGHLKEIMLDMFLGQVSWASGF